MERILATACAVVLLAELLISLTLLVATVGITGYEVIKTFWAFIRRAGNDKK